MLEPVKISELDPAAALDGTEIFPLVQTVAGVLKTVKAPTAYLKTMQDNAAASAQTASDKAALAVTSAGAALISQTAAAASALAAAGVGTPGQATNAQLITWMIAQAWGASGVISYDANGAETLFGVLWPDGTPGTFTTITPSTAFLGSVDAWKVTYVFGGVTKTVTQSLVTRNATTGKYTNRPTPTVA